MDTLSTLPSAWSAAGRLDRDLPARFLPKQVPALSVDFTTFTWKAILRRTLQMLGTGATVEEGLDWTPRGQGTANRAVSTLLTVRITQSTSQGM
jgi:hypothetical protein